LRSSRAAIRTEDLKVARCFIALVVAWAVVSAPAVSRARLFCRATGDEVPTNLCPDEASASSPEFVSERCCEHRVQPPLPAAKSESSIDWVGVVSPVQVELVWFVAPAYSPPAPSFEVRPPPLTPLSATDILLI